jgi:transposase InsO family protein
LICSQSPIYASRLLKPGLDF